MTRFVRVWARILLAPIVVTAFAILVRGYASTGDGFAAGVVAATGVFLQYVAFGRRRVDLTLAVRHAGRLVGVGLCLALAVVFAPTLTGNALVTHVPRPGEKVWHLGALELHTAVLFDLGVFLVVVGALIGMLHWIAAPVARREVEADP